MDDLAREGAHGYAAPMEYLAALIVVSAFGAWIVGGFFKWLDERSVARLIDETRVRVEAAEARGESPRRTDVEFLEGDE